MAIHGVVYHTQVSSHMDYLTNRWVYTVRTNHWVYILQWD